MACAPKREITSLSAAPQWGQWGALRGASGSAGGTAGHEFALFEAPQHREGARVDGAPPAAAPARGPGSPIRLEAGRFYLQSLLHPAQQLGRPRRQLALLVQPGDLSV